MEIILVQFVPYYVEVALSHSDPKEWMKTLRLHIDSDYYHNVTKDIYLIFMCNVNKAIYQI